jgi:hypothetical protein
MMGKGSLWPSLLCLCVLLTPGLAGQGQDSCQTRTYIINTTVVQFNDDKGSQAAGTGAGAGAKELCRQYRVSFETCRLLLERAPVCVALSYSQTTYCKLLGRTEAAILEEKQEKTTLLAENGHGERVSSDESRMSRYDAQGSARSRFLSCAETGAEVERKFPTEDVFDKLPRLLIVISFTTSWATLHEVHVKKIRQHWLCYARAHGYMFSMNYIDQHSLSSFFMQRHDEVRQKFLPLAQYVLHLDGDTVVLHLSRSLEFYLALNKSVLLQMRENMEVSSSSSSCCCSCSSSS